MTFLLETPMFLLRQLRVEARRALPWILVISALLVGRVLLSMELASSWQLWRLVWLVGIAHLVLAEPFTRRAFWRTRPIPRRGLLSAKGVVLLVGFWLPTVLTHTTLLWRMGSPADILPWLSIEAGLYELLYLLVAIAVALASRNGSQAVATLTVLWLGAALFPDLGSEFDVLAPRQVRDGLRETAAVALLLTLPALVAWIAWQTRPRPPRRAALTLTATLALCLFATVGVRTLGSPWRLDPAPLHRDSWDGLADLKLRSIDPDNWILEPVPFGDDEDRRLVAELVLGRELPPGHGLEIRQVRSTLELPSGRKIRSRLAEGEWSCEGRKSVWGDSELGLPSEERCDGLATVPVAQLDGEEADWVHRDGARLWAELEVDLFRFELESAPWEGSAQPPETGCHFGPRASRWGSNDPLDVQVFRRSFSGLLRRDRLPSFSTHLWLPAASGSEVPRILDTRSLGGSTSWPPWHLISPAPVPRDVRYNLGRLRDDGIDVPTGLAVPEGTLLVCEERILVDRATLYLEIADLRPQKAKP